MTLRPSLMKRPVASSSTRVRSMEGWKEKSKSRQALDPGQPGEVHAGVDDPLAAGRQLRLEEPAKEVGVGPAGGGGLLGDLVELAAGGLGADLLQAVGGELLVVDAHCAASA